MEEKEFLKKLDCTLNEIYTNSKSILKELNDEHDVSWGDIPANNIRIGSDKDTPNIVINFNNTQFEMLHNMIGNENNINVDGKYRIEKAFLKEVKCGACSAVLSTGNVFYNENNLDKLNLVIWNKPQYLKNLSNYVENSNLRFLCFNLDDVSFYLLYKGDKLFLVSKCLLEKNKFEKYAKGIKLALGFLMCDFIGGDEIFISADEEFKKINGLKTVAMSQEQNLNFNIFVDCMSLAKTFIFNEDNNAATRLSSSQFSKLCKLVIDSPQIETAINYIAQSSSLWTEFKLSNLSIALEALTQYVSNNITKDGEIANGNLLPSGKLMPDNKFNSFLTEFEACVNEFNFDLDCGIEETEKIKQMLINKMQNCKSNTKKLSEPFDIYGINLTEDDKKMLKKRNVFLHGNEFEYTENLQENIFTCKEQMYTCYYLLYVLLLRIIGYDGVIYNIKQYDRIIEINNQNRGKSTINENNNNNDDLIVHLGSNNEGRKL